jgi:hypothetical protein
MRRSAVAFLLLAACSGKTGTLRDRLAQGDLAGAASVVDTPACKEPIDGCLDDLARAFGAKKPFDAKNPDQADAAAVAVVIVREGRGDWVPRQETWLAAARTAKGSGADALRLAIAAKMAEVAPRLGKKIEDEKEATALVASLGTIFPGACATYAAMGRVAKLEDMPAEASPDHAPCVQRDLVRHDGPGAAYGYGVWRAAAAATTLWKEYARALREGTKKSDAAAALERALATIDAATAKLELKKVDAPGRAWSQGLEETHSDAMASPDAGAKRMDAGH